VVPGAGPGSRPDLETVSYRVHARGIQKTFAEDRFTVFAGILSIPRSYALTGRSARFACCITTYPAGSMSPDDTANPGLGTSRTIHSTRCATQEAGAQDSGVPVRKISRRPAESARAEGAEIGPTSTSTTLALLRLGRETNRAVERRHQTKRRFVAVVAFRPGFGKLVFKTRETKVARQQSDTVGDPCVGKGCFPARPAPTLQGGLHRETCWSGWTTGRGRRQSPSLTLPKNGAYLTAVKFKFRWTVSIPRQFPC
jgi:hypothetical protein